MSFCIGPRHEHSSKPKRDVETHTYPHDENSNGIGCTNVLLLRISFLIFVTGRTINTFAGVKELALIALHEMHRQQRHGEQMHYAAAINDIWI